MFKDGEIVHVELMVISARDRSKLIAQIGESRFTLSEADLSGAALPMATTASDGPPPPND